MYTMQSTCQTEGKFPVFQKNFSSWRRGTAAGCGIAHFCSLSAIHRSDPFSDPGIVLRVNANRRGLLVRLEQPNYGAALRRVRMASNYDTMLSLGSIWICRRNSFDFEASQ